MLLNLGLVLEDIANRIKNAIYIALFQGFLGINSLAVEMRKMFPWPSKEKLQTRSPARSTP